MDLNTAWFLLIGILIAGYAILDGFDLGVGVLHLFARNDRERRIHMNAIGPVWDGNEVWLLAAGGALFAVFPIVYATVFSGFYLAFMLLLFALIFRAVSLEFRGKIKPSRWRGFWDWCFGLGSLLPAVLFGVAVGNILRGLPIDANMMFTGSFLGLLNGYSLLIGVLSLALFTMHGAVYMTMKTEGELLERMRRWVNSSWIAVVILYSLATVASIFVSPYLFENTMDNLFFWLLLILLLGSLVYIPVATRGEKYFRAFFASSTAIACMIGFIGMSIYPWLVPSVTDLNFSLTIYNASSTPRTLKVMLTIVLTGMPLVIAYTIFIYRVFRGKVVLDEEEY